MESRVLIQANSSHISRLPLSESRPGNFEVFVLEAREDFEAIGVPLDCEFASYCIFLVAYGVV